MALLADQTEPAVDFLQLNFQIFGAPGPGDETGGGWLDRILAPFRRIIETSGEIRAFSTPGAVITTAWPYVFAFAGLILFAMLLWGSMEIMFGAATPKSAESGKSRITYAIIGFVLLFSVFWIGQIIQQIFGINFGIAAGGGAVTP